MKKIFLLLLLAALLILPSTTKAAERKQLTRGTAAIAAVVNDEVITVTDVRNRVQLYAGSAPKPPSAKELVDLEQQVLVRLIDEKLQLQEAKKLGISIEEDKLNDAFATIAQQNNTNPEEFRQRLKNAGVNLDTLYDQIRTDIAWSYVVRRKLRPQINVSESDIDSEMDVMEKSIGKNEYHVAEIFLPVDEQNKDARVLDQAQKLVKDMMAGRRFSDVAREFSKSPGANAGGDIGWVQEGQLDPKLDTALAKMQPGQLSPPVRSEKGYHIFFLRDSKINKPLNVAAKAPVETTASVAMDALLQLQRLTIMVEETDPEQIIKAKVVRADMLRAEVTNCAAMTTKAADFANAASGDLGTIRLSALPEPVAAAVIDLEIGTASAPVRTPEGIAIFMVCQREDIAAPVVAVAEPATEPAVENDAHLPKFTKKQDEASREKVANRLGGERLSQMQERYIRDLRATAFIDKRL